MYADKYQHVLTLNTALSLDTRLKKSTRLIVSPSVLVLEPSLHPLGPRRRAPYHQPRNPLAKMRLHFIWGPTSITDGASANA